MAIYRCNACGFVSEDAVNPVGSKIACGRCGGACTVYGTVFYVEKLVERYFAARGELRLQADATRRTATCTALDDVELIRIDKQVFQQLLQQVPALAKIVLARVKLLQAGPASQPKQAARPTTNSPILREFTEQGLYNAQRLLVLDLEACTRCDECTKACRTRMVA